MDAKPCRPSKPLSVLGTENIPPANKTLHQRHKSTGNLIQMSSAGGLHLAAKRNALADVNKPAKPQDESTTNWKSNAKMTASTVVKAQENQVPVSSKEAFLRPAQRPSRAGSLVPSASTSHLRTQFSGSNSSVASRPALPSRNTALPKPKAPSTFVYNDNVIVKEDPAKVSATSNFKDVAKSLRRFSVGQTTGPAQGIRALSTTTCKHVVPRFEGSSQSSQIPSLPSEVSETHSAPSTNDEDSRSTATSVVIEDDAHTSTPYLDAVEKISHHDQYPTAERAEEPLIPGPDLPEVPAHAIQHPAMPHPAVPRPARSETRMVEFEHRRTSLGPEFDHHEMSDYDDEDYYEDQGYITAHSYRSLGDNTTGGATTIMFPPKLTKKGAAEIQNAKDIVQSKRTVEEIQEDEWDVSMVAEYGEEIFSYMKELEINLLPNAHYMDIQTEIQWSMRSVLMDWVIQVHSRFGLLPETLFLTVNYIDRFLSCKVVSLGKLQLVGATALFVAAKYEEINCPSVQEIVYMVDGGYTIDEILKAERFMLSMLEFELGWPGPMSFLRRISKADDYDLETRTVAKYFLEVTIMDERFVASPPSYIAAGSHCLSRLMLNKGVWTPEHVHYSGYTYNQLKPLIRMMLDCCRIARKHHSAVFDKYSDKRYKRAASFVEGQLVQGFSLPFQQRVSFHAAAAAEMFEDEGSQAIYASSQALKMPIPIHG